MKNLKYQYFAFSIAIYATLFIMLFVAYAISNVMDQTPNADVEIVKQTLLNPGAAQPEPIERIVFLGSVIAMVLSLMFITPFLIKKYKEKVELNSTVNLLHIINFLLVLFIVFKAFKAPNPFAISPQNTHDTIAKTNFDFYFIKSFLHKNFLMYCFIIFPATALITLYNFKKPVDIISKLNLLSSKIALTISLLLCLLAYGLCTFDFPYTFENKYDLNAVYYSVVQVYHGNVLLSDNFTNTYGLYPHFIMPFLKIAGLSFSSFSTAMGILLAGCFILIHYFLNKTITNKWIIILTMCAIFYLGYAYSKVATNYDAYFAIHPIRWLFPCLLLALSFNFYRIKSNVLDENLVSFLKVGSISIIRILLFILFGFGILWNPDFGIFTFLSLVATIIFIDFDNRNLKLSIINSIIQISISIVSVAISFLLYKSIIFIVYGKSLDFSLMFTAIKSFAVVGFNMLPMPNTYHPWMLFALTYLIGWVVSVHSFYTNQKNKFTIGVFLLTLLGTLSFTYYQGRSHNWNLMATNFEAFLLLGIFTDKLISLSKIATFLKPILILCLFFIAFAPFQVLGSFSSIMDIISSKKDKQINIAEENQIKDNANYMKNNSTSSDSVLILSADHYQSLYHTLIGKPSAVNPGFIDLFTKTQYQDLVSKISSKKLKVFLNPNLYRTLNTDIINVLQASYDISNPNDSVSSIYIFNKKSFKNEVKFLSQANNLLYNQFNQNSAANLELTKGKIISRNNASVFSLEFIFKPISNRLSQLTQNQALITAFTDSLNFAVQQNGDNKNQYIFGTKNSGYLFNISAKQLNYVAININNNMITIFVNGIKQVETLMNKTINLKQQKIYIGSYNNQGAFYFGNIKELKISNNLLTSNEISNTQNKILNEKK
jgi:hypothetical protein